MNILEFVKALSAMLVSIGFPIAKEAVEANSLNNIAQQLSASGCEITKYHVRFALANNLKSDYKKWLLQLDYYKPDCNDALLSEPGDLHTTDLIRRRKGFDLAHSTPR